MSVRLLRPDHCVWRRRQPLAELLEDAADIIGEDDPELTTELRERAREERKP